MRKYSEAQRKSVQRYRSKFKFVNLRLEAGEFEELRKEAISVGLSLNSYINSIIKNRKRTSSETTQTLSTDPGE